MFLPPLYSVLVLAALAGLYLVVRYKHGGPLLLSRSDVDSWWVRQLARIWAFRTWIVNALGGILIAAPDIIVALVPVDLTPLIGAEWAKTVGGAMIVFNAINAALRTKPPGQAA